MAKKLQKDITLGRNLQDLTDEIESPKHRFLGMFLMVLLVALLLASFGVAFYFYTQYQNALTNPQALAQQSSKSLSDTLSKLIELPDEEPTIATVSDKSKLQSQPFFTKAENGDKVFIYTNAKKAILYRPANNKIIEVATISLDEDLNTQQ